MRKTMAAELSYNSAFRNSDPCHKVFAEHIWGTFMKTFIWHLN